MDYALTESSRPDYNNIYIHMILAKVPRFLGLRKPLLVTNYFIDCGRFVCALPIMISMPNNTT